jgi:hypothetical protein
MDHGTKALNQSNWIDKQCLSHYILRMRIKGSLSKVLLIAVAVSLVPFLLTTERNHNEQ